MDPFVNSHISNNCSYCDTTNRVVQNFTLLQHPTQKEQQNKIRISY